MLNSRTFFGTDGSLVFSDPAGIDPAVFTKHFGETGVVGQVTGVTVNVSTEIKPAHSIGKRSATELRTGKISISGSVERAYINGAMLKLMLGQYAESEEAAGFLIPSFGMKLILNNQQVPGDAGSSVINIYGVIFNSWQVNLPEDDFMLEKLSFQARRISITDKELS